MVYMIYTHVKDSLNMTVIKGIKAFSAFTAAFYHPRSFKGSKLMRNRRLAHLHRLADAIDAQLSCTQRAYYPYSGGIAEDGKYLGKCLQFLFIRDGDFFCFIFLFFLCIVKLIFKLRLLKAVRQPDSNRLKKTKACGYI